MVMDVIWRRLYVGFIVYIVYLGSQFTSDARCEKEIRRRIGIVKSAFTSMSKVLTSRDIHMTDAEMLCVGNTAIWM